MQSEGLAHDTPFKVNSLPVTRGAAAAGPSAPATGAPKAPAIMALTTRITTTMR
jgi:hypothetical protein